LANVIVDELHADLAGLQECMSEDEMAEGFDGRMLKAPGTDNFNCIFYKPGVVEFLGISGRRYLGDYGRDHYSERYVSYAKMRFSDVEFWLFSTHWCLNNDGCQGPAGGLKHKHSAQVMCDLRKELGSDIPAIITADTESHMDGVIWDDGVQWLLNHGWTLVHQGAWAFDMIFVSNGDWNVGAKVNGPMWPSDHPSLSVRLSPDPGRPHRETLICAAFDYWPDIDNGVTCGNCAAIVSTSPYGGRCDRYCESFGHVCVAAAEEMSEQCVIQVNYGCDADIPVSSDMLCQCQHPPTTTSTTSTTTTTISVLAVLRVSVLSAFLLCPLVLFLCSVRFSVKSGAQPSMQCHAFQTARGAIV
jgi:hypothetical protein